MWDRLRRALRDSGIWIGDLMPLADPDVQSAEDRLTLVAIAWACFWLIRDGVNVELLGGLMIDAFALAEVFWSATQE